MFVLDSGQRMDVAHTEHEQKLGAMKQAQELRLKQLRHDVELGVKDAHERAKRGMYCGETRVNTHLRYVCSHHFVSVVIIKALLHCDVLFSLV